jgi:KDO2-lipid IV(A) lauroyltransferase
VDNRAAQLVRTRVYPRVVWLLRRLPRRLLTPSALVLAALLFVLYRRGVVRANLAFAFPEWSSTQRRQTVWAYYKHLARLMVESLHTTDYTEVEFRDRVVLEQKEVMSEALARGQGVVFLTGHFGNWEWLARRAAIEWGRLAVLYSRPHDDALDELLVKLRGEAGMTLIKYTDARSSIRWLRKGGILGITMDQEPLTGVTAPLFGRPALTHAGPFRLARMAHSVVVTGFCHRVGTGRYRARFEPFPLTGAKSDERAILVEATEFNARLEDAVRRNPDQWLWTHRRWKRAWKLKPDQIQQVPAPLSPRS